MSIQVIDRAFQLIGLIAGQREASVANLSRQARLPISTAARIIGSLTSHGVLERTPGRRYRLGGRLFILASQVEPTRNRVETARSVMLELSRETGEDVGFAILQDREALIVDWVYGNHPIKVIEPFTSTVTLNCAFRKALLAYKNDAWVDRYIEETEFPAYTPDTITDAAAIRSELKKVRAEGIAISRGENIMDAGSVAAPVFDHNGELAGTIFVTAPLSRFDGDNLPGLIETIVSSANSLTCKFRPQKPESSCLTSDNF